MREPLISGICFALGAAVVGAFVITSLALADQQPNPHFHWPDSQYPVGESGAAIVHGPTIDGRAGMVKSIFAEKPHFTGESGAAITPSFSTRLNFVIAGEQVFSIFRNRDSTYAVELAPGILWDESGQKFWDFVNDFSPARQLP